MPKNHSNKLSSNRRGLANIIDGLRVDILPRKAYTTSLENEDTLSSNSGSGGSLISKSSLATVYPPVKSNTSRYQNMSHFDAKKKQQIWAQINRIE